MLHGLASSQPLVVVVAQKLVKEIEALRRDKVLVFRMYETFPALSWMSS